MAAPLSATLTPGTNLWQHPGTGEYFDNYDAFFEQAVLHMFPRPHPGKVKKNSGAGEAIVWHERNLPKIDIAEYSTKLDFHVELVELFLVPLAPMRSLNGLVGMLYDYLTARFMKSEAVVLFHNSAWVSGKIRSVRMDLVTAPGVILDGTRMLPENFLYDVEVAPGKMDFGKKNIVIRNVRCVNLRRPQGTFSRPLIRQSILQHCKCREPRKSDSIWSLKKKTVEYYDLNSLSWWDMFAGAEPRFMTPPKPSKRFPRKEKSSGDAMSNHKLEKMLRKKHREEKTRKSSQEVAQLHDKKRKHAEASSSIIDVSSKRKKVAGDHREQGTSKPRHMTPAEKARMQEERKLKQQEYKKRWREKMKADKEKLSNVWAKVFSVGEDMECQNLQALPIAPRHLETVLPEQFIGDGVFILEFLNIFGREFDKQTYLLQFTNWDLDRLHRALASDTVEGDLTGLLGFCAKALMSCVPQLPESGDTVVARYVSGWQQQGASVIRSTHTRLGISFHNLPISGSTISEVIRMCLLAACVPLHVQGPTEPKSDGVILRYMKSAEGLEMYRTILAQSVFALSFSRRIELLMILIQAIVESDTVRGMVDLANTAIEDGTKHLKRLKTLSEEVGKLVKPKLLIPKDRPVDKPSEKNDQFRHIIDFYIRKRTGLRSERPKTAFELVEDLRCLQEGRKRRRLTESDVAALAEAFVDLKAKAESKLQEERSTLTESMFFKGQNFRLEPIGMDRHFFKYWFLPSVPGLLIECNQVSVCSTGCFCEKVKQDREESYTGSSWWILRNEEEINVLSKHLLINGEREVALKRALDLHVHSVNRLALTVNKGTVVETTASSRTTVPAIFPTESWDEQLFKKVKLTLTTLNSNLQSSNLGGLQDDQLKDWLADLHQPASQDAPVDYSRKRATPSPEFTAPAAAVQEDKPLVNLTNGFGDDHSSPNSAIESAMESMEIITEDNNTQSQQQLQLEKQNGDDATSSIRAATDSSDTNSEVSSRREQSLTPKEDVVQPAAVPSVVGTVGHLITCILHLVDTIRPRYLGAPLVLINEDTSKDINPLNRWKNALQTCSNVSQLNLYLSVLEHCILWDRSLVNALCKACRRKGEVATFVVCDRCDRIYHLNCVLPPLRAVPQEEWICPICEPSVVLPRNKRAARGNVNYSEDSALAEKARPPSLDIAAAQANAEAKLTARTARALQRGNPGLERQNSIHSEDGYAAIMDMDGVRRSGRAKRIDYKGLIEGTNQKEDDTAEEADEDEPPSAEVFSDDLIQNDYGSDSESSASSEYDPETPIKPQWGKTHKRIKR